MRLDDTDTHKRRAMTEASTIPAAITALANAQIAVARVDDAEYCVDERFAFFPANGFWRDLAGTVRGYGTRALIAAVKTRSAAEQEQAHA